jgi:hypothetical protein
MIFELWQPGYNPPGGGSYPVPGQQVRPATQPIAGLQQDEVHTHTSVPVARLCAPASSPRNAVQRFFCVLLCAQGFYLWWGFALPGSSDVSCVLLSLPPATRTSSHPCCNAVWHGRLHVLANIHRLGRRSRSSRCNLLGASLRGREERAWSLLVRNGWRARARGAIRHSFVDRPRGVVDILTFHEIRKHSTGCPHPPPLPSSLSPPPAKAACYFGCLLYRCCGLCVRRGCALMEEDMP